MARYKRKVDEIEAEPITPALIANRDDIFAEAVISPFTGLPVRPEEEEQAANAGWPRVTYLVQPNVAPAAPLTIAKVGHFLITDADGGLSIIEPTAFAKTFVQA